MKKNYYVRKVLGMYWLLDINTDGLNYRTPPCLNETGMYIWQRAADGKSMDAIAEDMHRDFGIEEKTAKSDVCAFLGMMSANGIL